MNNTDSVQRRKLEKLVLSIIVAVYNEEDSISSFLQRTESLRTRFSKKVDIEYIFVSDGSTDETVDLLLRCQAINPSIHVIELSRNFGKEAAITAGLHFSSGNVVVPIDVDGQDPPELIIEMLNKWLDGYDVVLAKRIDRGSDSFAKRFTAKLYYKIHNLVSEIPIPEDVGDFRLMDIKVVEALRDLSEHNRFMKGLFSWVGFRTISVDYVREPRRNGESKFHGWKLWNFALNGITSFGYAPLKVWMYIGVLISFGSFIFAIMILIRVLATGVDVPGYASVIVALTFLGGLQLMGIGLIGEYLGRTYIESKRRPPYVIRRTYRAGDRPWI